MKSKKAWIEQIDGNKTLMIEVQPGMVDQLLGAISSLLRFCESSIMHSGEPLDRPLTMSKNAEALRRLETVISNHRHDVKDQDLSVISIPVTDKTAVTDEEKKAKEERDKECEVLSVAADLVSKAATQALLFKKQDRAELAEDESTNLLIENIRSVQALLLDVRRMAEEAKVGIYKSLR